MFVAFAALLSSPALALVLAQAEPPPVSASAAANEPAGAAAVAEGADIPKGAPSDDYGLVSWCEGALSGHMALYELVKPELKSIERKGEAAEDEESDREQMKAGREYLALYRRARTTAEKEDPSLHARGQEAEAMGEAIWTAPRKADARTRMWSWLLWELPGRCETAAKRLETRSGLLGAAFKDTAAAAPQ